MTLARALAAAARPATVTSNGTTAAIAELALLIADCTRKIRVNRDAAAALSRRVDDLVAAVDASEDLDSTIEWIQGVESFKAVLLESLDTLREQSQRSYLAQVLTQDRDADRLNAISERLNHSFSALMLSARLSVHALIDSIHQHEPSALIDSIDALAVEARAPIAQPPVPASQSFPPEPPVCFGRAAETRAIVDLIRTRSPARVAVMGGPGMGKTSLALVVLHEPLVASIFGNNRYFVDCGPVDNTLQIVSAALGKTSPNKTAARRNILGVFASAPSLLVLDDFPSSRPDAEEALGFLGGINGLSILLTARGSEHPSGISWTRPFLPPLQPLSADSSMQVFMTISGVVDDRPVTRQLLDSLDHLPLAVTLMASLAQFESPDFLLARWDSEKSAMLTRGHDSPLLSLDASIRVSLHSPVMLNMPNAQRALSLLSILPDGADEDDFALFTSHLSQNRRCVSTVLRTALAHRSGHRILALAPIRAFMLLYHPPDEALARPLYEHYFAAIDSMQAVVLTQTHEVLETVRSELANMNAVVRHALEHSADKRGAVAAALQACRVLGEVGLWTHSQLLPTAIEVARAQGFRELLAACLSLSGAHAFVTAGGRAVSRVLLEEAVDIYKELRDVPGQLQAAISCARACETIPGELDELQVVLQEADRRGDDRLAVKAMTALSRTYRKLPDGRTGRPAALHWLHKALERAQATLSGPDGARIVREIQSSICNTQYECGDLARALPVAIALAAEMDREGQVSKAPYQAFVVANILVLQGRARSALPYATGALNAHRSTGNLLMQSWISSLLGSAHLELGDYARARTFYDDARDLAAQMGDYWSWGKGDALLNYAELAVALGDADSALAHAQAALDVFRRAEYMDDEARAIHVLGKATAVYDAEAAADRFVLAAVLNWRCAEHIELLKNLTSLGRAFLASGDTTASSRVAEALLPSLYRAQLRPLLVEALACLAADASRPHSAVLALRSRRSHEQCER